MLFHYTAQQATPLAPPPFGGISQTAGNDFHFNVQSGWTVKNAGLKATIIVLAWCQIGILRYSVRMRHGALARGNRKSNIIKTFVINKK